MPTNLTSEQMAKVAHWWQTHVSEVACPFCQQRDWEVEDRYTILPFFNPLTGGGSPGSGEPAILVICGNCGYIAPFSAMSMGIRTQEKEEPRRVSTDDQQEAC